MLFIYYRWLRPSLLLTFGIVIVLLVFTYEINSLILLVCIFTFTLIFYQLVVELWVAMAFISPGNKKKNFSLDGWYSKEHNLGTRIHSQSYFHDDISPLVILIHGWRSGAISMLGRAQKYIDLGMHVIIFEMPGHGESEAISKWSAGHTSMKFVTFFSQLDEDFEMELVSDIYLHGHSMGGFVLLKFNNYLETLNNCDKVRGYILESPMTCYSLIFNQTAKLLRVPKFMQTIFWNRLRDHFNAINPTLENISEPGNADVPDWGIISHSLLIVQAETDNRLGRAHYDNLIKSQKDAGYQSQLEHHLVPSLTHSGARENIARDQIIKNWISRVSIHSDSVESA